MTNKWKVFKISDPCYKGYQPWRVLDPSGAIRMTARSFEDVKNFFASYSGWIKQRESFDYCSTASTP